MFQSHMLLGPIDVTSDSQLLLVAGARIEISNSPPALTLEYGITTQRVFGKATPQFLALGTIDANTIARPLQMGDVRVQP